MATLNDEVISKISAAEQQITHQCDCTDDGPTAMTHNHAGEGLNAQNVLHDITEGEKNITYKASDTIAQCRNETDPAVRQARPIAGGPTAIAQSTLAKVCSVNLFVPQPSLTLYPTGCEPLKQGR